MSLIKPFKGNYRVSQTFGNDLVINGVHVYQKFGLLAHNGLDYATPMRTPITASHEGDVIEATFDPDGYGWYPHLENTEEGTIYGHMDELVVKVGYHVKQGDLLGYSGNTGNSTGPHLHFGYYKKPRNRSNGYNGYIDPTPYLQEGDTPMTEAANTLNTYNLDDNNLESKQIVYNTWNDVANKGLYVPKADHERLMLELNSKIEALNKQLSDVKTITNDNFNFLSEVEALGFKNIDELKSVTTPYLTMFQAGFPDLKSIQDKITYYQDQLNSSSKTILQITSDLQYANKVGSDNLLAATELRGELEKLKIEYASYDKNSTVNRIARFIEMVMNVTKFKPADKKVGNLSVEDVAKTVSEIKPEQLQSALTAWDSFKSSMGISINKQ